MARSVASTLERLAHAKAALADVYASSMVEEPEVQAALTEMRDEMAEYVPEAEDPKPKKERTRGRQ